MATIGSSTSKPTTSAPPAAASEPARSVWSSLRETGSELWQRVQDRFRTAFSRDQFQAGGQNPSESRAVSDFAATKNPGIGVGTGSELDPAHALNPARIDRAIEIGTRSGYITDATRATSDAVAGAVMGVPPGETATGAARQIGFEEIRNQLSNHVPADQLDQRMSRVGAANIDGAMQYINQATDAADQQARVSRALQALVTMEQDPNLFAPKVHGKNIIQTPFIDGKTRLPAINPRLPLR